MCRIVRKLDAEARENILTEGAATDKQLMLLSGELEEFSRGVLVRVIRGFAGLGDLGSVEARALSTAARVRPKPSVAVSSSLPERAALPPLLRPRWDWARPPPRLHPGRGRAAARSGTAVAMPRCECAQQ